MRYDSHAKTEDSLVRAAKAILVGIIVGSIVCVILLMVCSLLFVRVKNIPEAVIGPLTIGIAAIGAFLSGYVAVRIVKIKGLIYGMLSGFLLFVILFVAGLVIARESLTMMTLIKCILSVLMGGIGGIIGVNKRAK